MRVEIEIPDDSRGVPMVTVLYLDGGGTLQAHLTFRPEAGVPLKDCLDLNEKVTANGRRRART